MRTQNTYEELQALLILHNLLGLNLEEWNAADCPDLQNHADSWGIEVVQDVYPKEIESAKHLASVWNTPYTDWPPSKVRILKKNKVKLTVKDNVIHTATLGETSINPHNTIQVIKNKIDLLNRKKYHSLNRYDLYVIVETTCIDANHVSFVKQIIDEISTYQQNAELKYTMLYLAHHYSLCICNLEIQSFEHRVISADLQEKIRSQMTQMNYT